MPVKSLPGANTPTIQDPWKCLSNETVPVLLITKGRAGSTSTWMTLASLMGGGCPAKEHTGSDPTAQRQFFSRHKTGNWLPALLCMQQKRYKKGIVGTKWKPFYNLSEFASSRSALEMVRENPAIKVVLSQRNPLDVKISGIKHSRSKLPSHCAKLNKKCLNEHFSASTGITLNISTLMKELEIESAVDERIDSELHSLGIPHVQVTYEELYFADSAVAWQRILEFLGRPSPSLTMTAVHKKMVTAATSNSKHSITLANYEDVRALLAGSKFERLLH